MARHRTRRENMSPRKRQGYDHPTNKWSFKVFAAGSGILMCTIAGIYFAFSTPEAEGNREVRGSTTEWQEVKKNWKVEPLSPKQFGLVSEAVELERLENEYLRNIMYVRTPGSENSIRVKDFLVRTMRNLGWEVEEDTFEENPPKSYSANPVTFTNVIATFNPNARRRLVLACHYDSKVTPEGFLGAIDSAVPCAMMLEIAKALDDYLPMSPKDTDLTLQLIFFDGEEAFVKWTSTDSIYGARHLAKKWEELEWPAGSNGETNMLHSIDLFVLLDLLGEKNPSFYDMTNVPTPHYKELTRIEKLLNDRINYFKAKSVNAMIEDDHIPFLRRKVPILHVIPIPFPDNWHKITDDGNNLDNVTIHRLTKIFAVFVAEYLHLKPIAF